MDRISLLECFFPWSSRKVHKREVHGYHKQIMLWRCGTRAVSTLGQLAISLAPKTHVKSQVSGVKNKNQTKTTTYLNEVLVSYLMEGFDKVSTSLEGNLPSPFLASAFLIALHHLWELLHACLMVIRQLPDSNSLTGISGKKKKWTSVQI